MKKTAILLTLYLISFGFCKAQNINTFAGNGTGGYLDGSPATAGELNYPYAVAVGPNGNIYISDQVNSVIRMTDPHGNIISTVVGSAGSSSDNGDGGPASNAELSGPSGIVFDAAGNMYIAT